MPYVYAACTVCVIIFSTSDKFRPVSNFTELHALTLAAHSCALLVDISPLIIPCDPSLISPHVVEVGIVIKCSGRVR